MPTLQNQCRVELESGSQNRQTPARKEKEAKLGVLVRTHSKCLGTFMIRITAQITMLTATPQKHAPKVNRWVLLSLASLNLNCWIKNYWGRQTLAYLQSQTNTKYASTAKQSAKLFHSMHFFFLELQAQREARHLANEQSKGWVEHFLQGRRGWLVASFVFLETQLHGLSRVRI